MNLFEVLLNYIFPIKCGICNKITNNKAICYNCMHKIKKLERVKVRNVNNSYYTKHLYIFDYNGLVRNKIIDYKFRDKAYLYKFFSEIILNNKKICKFIKSYDIIIPVSIHKKRFKKRGYNQTELIAEYISKNLKLNYKNNVLVKIQNTKSQSTLKKFERKQNLIGAYKVINKEQINNKKIILLDDVYTTGSTANECSKVLKKAGVKEVGILTITKD